MSPNIPRSKNFHLQICRCLILSVCLLSSSLNAADEVPTQSAPKVAVVGDFAKFAKEIDLLSVELSKEKGIAVLERSEWDALIREYETSAGRLKLAKHAGADALLIVDGLKHDGREYLVARLVAVRSGVVVDLLALPLDGVSELMKIPQIVARHFREDIRRISSSGENLKTVSLLNFRAETASASVLEFENSLNSLIAVHLMSQKDIIVCERDSMQSLVFEAVLKGSTGEGFETARWMVDGGFSVTGEKVELTLQLADKSGKTQKKSFSGSMKNVPGLAQEIGGYICKELGSSSLQSEKFDKAAEARKYLEEAEWAFNCGLYGESAQAAEAAYALGCEDQKLNWVAD